LRRVRVNGEFDRAAMTRALELHRHLLGAGDDDDSAGQRWAHAGTV